ncbi:uncharacterized protein LDX57_002524 [Aspergillus melleus]|uniref:uncharacterized protein n=1 Tax=Aspergillus melleus TaxID=138277 RepID=UPI001E8EA4A5|nr:uncharacterized protein LDX57_002524 [Aspergillus melleus]KAH8424781.1 hypothetical protein LDX57_002524 [Aspergillus melleus]
MSELVNIDLVLRIAAILDDTEQGKIQVTPEQFKEVELFLEREKINSKIPDTFLIPRGETIWPGLAFEFGYTESFEDLKQDADLLLRGSEGRIETVIIVKLDPLRANETRVEGGFVEIYVFDPESGESRKRGQRMTLYPLPINHTQQRIQLEWEDILRQRLDLHVSQVQKPPPLMLDALQEIIEEYTERDLNQLQDWNARR